MPAVRKLREDPVCIAKRRYTDEPQTIAAAIDSLERFPGETALWYYRCPHCNGWHLTKKNHGNRFKVTLENRN